MLKRAKARESSGREGSSLDRKGQRGPGDCSQQLVLLSPYFMLLNSLFQKN